jgi:hypothetical protein
MNKYKVTIEGGDFKTPYVLEYDHMNLTLERGICRVPSQSGGWGHCDIQPNGQARACIQLWTGCKEYDSFDDGLTDET